MPRRILIAARDPLVCSALSDMLRNSDAEADTAESGEKALQLMLERDYTLLLVAVRPQDADASALLETLSRHPAAQTLAVGPFTYNTATLRLYKDGREIPLTGRENALMKLFLDNTDRVFTRDMLYDLVWGSRIVDDNAVAVYISRLRQKIEDRPSEPRYLQTVRGIGYRFTP